MPGMLPKKIMHVNHLAQYLPYNSPSIYVIFIPFHYLSQNDIILSFTSGKTSLHGHVSLSTCTVVFFF